MNESESPLKVQNVVPTPCMLQQAFCLSPHCMIPIELCSNFDLHHCFFLFGKPVEDTAVSFGHCHLILTLCFWFVAFTVAEVAVETEPAVSYHDILIGPSIHTCLWKRCSFYLIITTC